MLFPQIDGGLSRSSEPDLEQAVFRGAGAVGFPCVAVVSRVMETGSLPVLTHTSYQRYVSAVDSFFFLIPRFLPNTTCVSIFPF